MLGNKCVQLVPVAQWIARWTSNPKVAGSNPAGDKDLFKFLDLIPKNSRRSKRISEKYRCHFLLLIKKLVSPEFIRNYSWKKKQMKAKFFYNSDSNSNF